MLTTLAKSPSGGCDFSLMRGTEKKQLLTLCCTQYFKKWYIIHLNKNPKLTPIQFFECAGMQEQMPPHLQNKKESIYALVGLVETKFNEFIADENMQGLLHEDNYVNIESEVMRLVTDGSLEDIVKHRKKGYNDTARLNNRTEQPGTFLSFVAAATTSVISTVVNSMSPTHSQHSSLNLFNYAEKTPLDPIFVDKDFMISECTEYHEADFTIGDKR